MCVCVCVCVKLSKDGDHGRERTKAPFSIERVLICIYIRESLNKFPDFFVWALLLIVHT